MEGRCAVAAVTSMPTVIPQAVTLAGVWSSSLICPFLLDAGRHAGGGVYREAVSVRPVHLPPVAECFLLFPGRIDILLGCCPCRFDHIPLIVRILPDPDLAAKQAVLRAAGDAQVIASVVREPPDGTADPLAADQAPG